VSAAKKTKKTVESFIIGKIYLQAAARARPTDISTAFPSSLKVILFPAQGEVL